MASTIAISTLLAKNGNIDNIHNSNNVKNISNNKISSSSRNIIYNINTSATLASTIMYKSNINNISKKWQHSQL